MRAVFFICVAFFVGFACGGDCKSCHSKLDYKNDKRHSVMLECKKCHNDESMAKMPMGDACGKDCFACHEIQKLSNPSLASSHNGIQTCIECHTKLKNNFFKGNIFDKTIKSFDNSFLKDIKP